MRSKTTIMLLFIAAAICFYSFKEYSGENNPKSVLVSFNSAGKGDNEGFLICYGDGRIEKRPLKVKMIDQDTWIEVHRKAATISEELREKGYHYKGSHLIFWNAMVFERD